MINEGVRLFLSIAASQLLYQYRGHVLCRISKANYSTNHPVPIYLEMCASTSPGMQNEPFQYNQIIPYPFVGRDEASVANEINGLRHDCTGSIPLPKWAERLSQTYEVSYFGYIQLFLAIWNHLITWYIL